MSLRPGILYELPLSEIPFELYVSGKAERNVSKPYVSAELDSRPRPKPMTVTKSNAGGRRLARLAGLMEISPSDLNSDALPLARCATVAEVVE